MTTTASTERGTAPRLNFGFDRFSGFYLWGLFIVVFGIWTPDLFLTANTVRSV
ncbi:MAG: Permease component of ribose/xylose/arabinose/galactoside ABC-type transporter, partial [Marmoricola sp.]|nr:Permease component of ribose/xylose/arabinose/galactoside ABC-type transporter [Marmoricola sp.]